MVVVVLHFVEDRVGLFRRFGWVYRRLSVICFMLMFVVCPVDITFVVVCETVGALQRSRVVSRRGAVGIRRVVVSTVYYYVGWSLSTFRWHELFFNRRIFF